jgi:hypothetical protein
MPLVKRHKITELFTRDEVNAHDIVLECKQTKQNFNSRCTNEVVEPALPRVKHRQTAIDEPCTNRTSNNGATRGRRQHGRYVPGHYADHPGQRTSVCGNADAACTGGTS